MRNYILIILLSIIGFIACSEKEPCLSDDCPEARCAGDIEELGLFRKDSLLFNLPLHEKIYNPILCAGVYLKSIEDSRCPVDLVCIWEGEVTATLEVTIGNSVEIISLKNTDPGKSLTVKGVQYTVRLVDVRPYPGEKDTSTPYAIIEVVRKSL